MFCRLWATQWVFCRLWATQWVFCNLWVTQRVFCRLWVTQWVFCRLWGTQRVLCNKHKLLTLCNHFGSHSVFFYDVRVDHHFSFLCCVYFFVCLRSVSSVQCCCISVLSIRKCDKHSVTFVQFNYYLISYQYFQLSKMLHLHLHS